MSKRNKIIYWIATLWLALGMLSTGAVQVFKLKAKVDFITNLGYPTYFMTILGVWKFLGVIIVLSPKFPLLKEWAYAGFFFIMSGAVLSHLAAGDPGVFDRTGDDLEEHLRLCQFRIAHHRGNAPPDDRYVIVSH